MPPANLPPPERRARIEEIDTAVQQPVVAKQPSAGPVAEEAEEKKSEKKAKEKVETPATEARPPAAFRRVQGRSGGGAITDIRAPGRQVKTLGSF